MQLDSTVNTFMKKELSKEEFRLLKDRLAGAVSAIQLSLRRCPDLEGHIVRLEDGRELRVQEILQWLSSARDYIWQFGPKEVRLKKAQQMIKRAGGTNGWNN